MLGADRGIEMFIRESCYQHAYDFTVVPDKAGQGVSLAQVRHHGVGVYESDHEEVTL